MQLKSLVALLALATTSTGYAAATPSIEEMWQIIQRQQAEIDRLKAEQDKNVVRIKETEVTSEATIAAVEQLAQSPVAAANKTRIGGYAEMHYNNLETDDGSEKNKELDLHRFVLLASHQFNDSVRFYSEFEIEHSFVEGGEEHGEVEMEQAFVEWDYASGHRARAGVFLIPVGIINETHEPETFYGVERNGVEHDILPASWWEGGIASQGELGTGFSYDLAIHSGLFLDPEEGEGKGEFEIRDGRQKVSEARADNLAYTGRLKYTGIPGLEIAATLQYQTDLLQGESYGMASDIGATLFETHVAWQQGGFGLRALYAAWDIDGAINSIQSGADEQSGYYIEPSYRFNERIGLFARYSEWDNLAGDSLDSEITQWDIGLNYWLTDQVVFKADYQNQDAPSDSGSDGFNLGVGLSF